MQSNSNLSLSGLAAPKVIPYFNLQNLLLLVSAACIACMFYISAGHSPAVETPVATATPAPPDGKTPFSVSGTSGTQSTASVSNIVADALAFKALLTSSQQTTLQQTYTTTLARKWSNLPCGAGCRNGIQIGALTTAQYAAAMQVIRDALSANTENGYDEYYQTCLAEAYLHINGGGNGYDSTLRWMCFLNTPSATGAWMLQFGGHHYAANIAFNNGHVIGATPFFMGTEPKVFTYNGKACSPLNSEHDAFANMLASLTSTQLASAKITQSFNDCYMIPGESNGGQSAFPATKVGLQCNSLTTSQKALLLAVIQNYTGDMDSATAEATTQVYSDEIDNSYIAFVGTGTSGNAGSFLSAQGNYARVDGPHIWLEFSCQGGIVIQGQIHYHTVWRDHTHDYGIDLGGGPIDVLSLSPLKLISFGAGTENKIALLKWVTANEVNVNRFEIEQSANAKDFAKIGTVKARNLISENNYSFSTPAQLRAGTTYFRLKMIDNDGKTTYSNVVNLHAGTVDKPGVVNTVVVNQLVITHPSTYTNANFKIVNLQGQTFKTGQLQQRVTTTSINVSSLMMGQYVIVIENGSEKYSTKFLKQ